jgi:hypothetical protein
MPGSIVYRKLGHVLLVEQDPAAVRLDQTNDHVKTSCFSGAIRTEQANDLALADLDRDILDNISTFEVFCKVLRA